jgi:hypothetical protein
VNVSRWFAMTLVALVVALAPIAANAEKPWWDPLNVTGNDKPKASAYKPAARKDSSWFKLPGFGDSSAKKPATRKNEPSTLTKMNNSTKRFFSGAADALTPWDNKKPAARKSPTGYGTGSQKSLVRGKQKEEDKGNILTSWWKDKEPEQKRPNTPSDFIAGERP